MTLHSLLSAAKYKNWIRTKKGKKDTVTSSYIKGVQPMPSCFMEIPKLGQLNL